MVLDLMKEVSEDKEDVDDDGGHGSDISGYHSDSESAVMTSGNSPFISKEARYSFLSRSVRLGSKHNVRASILASSLCLDSASMKSHSCAGSVSGRSVSGRSLSASRAERLGPPSLVLHSSSGVSSGSTSSDAGSHEDNKAAPLSPVPSSSSSQGTVKRSPNNGNANSGINSGKSTPNRPRHLKQRKEVFKSSNQGSTVGSIKSCCHRCSKDNDNASTIAGSEPVYQGIIERDISVIRKETEIAALKSEMAKVRAELEQAQKSAFNYQESENMLRERLASEKHRSLTLEKMASLQKHSNATNKALGGYTSLDQRPANLVRRYGELYSQMRLETLDSLDKLPQLVNSDELKTKLLFSVMVLAFRSVTNSIGTKRDQIRRILQLPPPPPPQGEDNKQKPESDDLQSLEPAARDLEEAVTAYLRRATENFDLSKNVEEVCSQIWATLYDYPCLKACDGIIKYVKECVRVAWGLVNQVPVYVIEYEARQFQADLHVRYHSADNQSDSIRTYLWPALLEGKDGPCVQKGVVIT